jgi:hypothetical protein
LNKSKRYGQKANSIDKSWLGTRLFEFCISFSFAAAMQRRMPRFLPLMSGA